MNKVKESKIRGDKMILLGKYHLIEVIYPMKLYLIDILIYLF